MGWKEFPVGLMGGFGVGGALGCLAALFVDAHTSVGCSTLAKQLSFVEGSKWSTILVSVDHATVGGECLLSVKVNGSGIGGEADHFEVVKQAEAQRRVDAFMGDK